MMVSSEQRNLLREYIDAMLESLGTLPVQVLIKYDDLNGHPIYKTEQLGFKCNLVDSGEALTYSVMLGHAEIVHFSIKPYPACCAMYQLNYFRTNDWELTQWAGESYDVQGTINTCCNAFFSAWGKLFGPARSIRNFQRIIINFVENDNRAVFDAEEDLSKHVIIEDRIYYPTFYKWAKSQKRIQHLTYRNQNSGNIIHTTEVILAKS